MYDQNGKFVPTTKNSNAPAEIRKRIASLRKQLAREKKVKDLLRKEQALRDQIKGCW
jgi:hypothetical protein